MMSRDPLIQRLAEAASRFAFVAAYSRLVELESAEHNAKVTEEKVRFARQLFQLAPYVGVPKDGLKVLYVTCGILEATRKTLETLEQAEARIAELAPLLELGDDTLSESQRDELDRSMAVIEKHLARAQRQQPRTMRRALVVRHSLRRSPLVRRRPCCRCRRGRTGRRIARRVQSDSGGSDGDGDGDGPPPWRSRRYDAEVLGPDNPRRLTPGDGSHPPRTSAPQHARAARAADAKGAP